VAVGKNGKLLERVRDRLLAARQQAGDAASPLQRDIDGLLIEIEDMLRQWFPAQDRVEDICAQAENLVKSAPEIGQLNLRVDRVAGELRSAREEMERLDDRDVSILGCQRIDEWERQLKGASDRATGGRELAFDGAYTEIARISMAVKRQAEAARKIVEARDLIRRVGKGPKTAALEIELGNFRDLFLRQEPSPEALEGFERILGPVRTVANTPPPPPPPPPASLKEVRFLMPQARRWVQALDADRTQLDALENRLAQAEAAPPGSTAADALRDDVSKFVASLRAQARLERDDKFHELSVNFRYYEDACGRDPQMAGLIESLQQLDIEQTDPNSFDTWRVDFGKARGYFDGLATAGSAMLESLCRTKVESCAARLAGVRERNLLDEVRRGCDAVKLGLDQLGVARGPAAALANLRAAGKLEEEIERLDRRSANDLESYSKARDFERGRKSELEGLAAKAGVSLLSMRSPDAPPQLSLGRCQEILDAFVKDLDAASNEFVQACHSASLDDHRFCESAACVLTSGAAPPLSPYPPALPDSPASAAAQRFEHAALRASFQFALEQQADALAARVKELRAALKDWSGDRTDDLHEARSLVDDIDSGGYDSEPDITERVRGLTEIRARCDNFFHRMERDRREAQEKLQRIRQRWRKFTERDLKIYYPEYSTRITGLLMGIPAAPRDWKSVIRQTEEIAAILGPLEKDALRRASADVEESVRVLSKRLPHAAADKKREIQGLLDSLTGTVNFPDSDTRRRLRSLRDDGSE
jgi:hypothetical protein